MNTVLSDECINALFDGTCFGEVIDGCVKEKRKLLMKSLKNQVDGFWSGNTIYHIMIDGGLLYDAKSNENKCLTALGVVFMEEYENNQR